MKNSDRNTLFLPNIVRLKIYTEFMPFVMQNLCCSITIFKLQFIEIGCPYVNIVKYMSIDLLKI